MAPVLHFYVRPSGHEGAATGQTLQKVQRQLPELQGVETELCYNVDWTAEAFPNAEEIKKLKWLFGCPLLLDDVAQKSWLLPGSNDLLLEVGPRYIIAFLLNSLHIPSTSIVSSSCDPQEICFAFITSYSLPWKLHIFSPCGTCLYRLSQLSDIF
uniref:Phosphoribosylformylglycinamidine synthase n=1 Tax=Spermophilus dauricus TaxID=99837 RepID=A0A8C9URM5_SPEDA